MKTITKALVVLALFAVVAAVPASAEDVTSLDIRSTVHSGVIPADGNVLWTANDFAAFWYDVDDGVSSELIYIDNNPTAGLGNDPAIGVGDTIAEDNMYYVSAPQVVQSKIGAWDAGATYVVEDADLENYNKMGFFGDEYLALDNDPSVLAKLLIEYDSSDKKTLSTGEEWELAEGWSLVAQQIDLDGNKVWLELRKDGTTIDSAIIDSDAVVATDRTYVYEDSDDRAIFYCYIDSVFRGVESNVVQLKYVFLRSDNLLEIDNGDTFGNFDVKGFTIPAGSAVIGQAPAGGAALAANDVALYMRSNTDITLDADDDDTIYGDVILHTADDAATLRCYLQKTITIAGAAAAEEEVTPTEEVTTPAEENVTAPAEGEEVTPTEEVTTPAEENVTAPAGEEGAAGEEEAGGAPGFEALFAVAGLLAVSYLVLRRRD